MVWRIHQLHWLLTSMYELEKTSLTIIKSIRLTRKWMHHASFNFETNALIFLFFIIHFDS